MTTAALMQHKMLIMMGIVVGVANTSNLYVYIFHTFLNRF